jgi:hypothetical protein
LESGDRSLLAEDMDLWQAVVNTVMNYKFHKRREFLENLSDCQLLKKYSAVLR